MFGTLIVLMVVAALSLLFGGFMAAAGASMREADEDAHMDADWLARHHDGEGR